MASTRKFFYASENAYTNIRTSIISTAMSAFTVAFSLAIFAIFAIIFANLQGVVTKWGERTHVVVYVKADNAEKVAMLRAGLKTVPGIERADYISSKTAFKNLKAEFKGHEAIFEGVEASLFPASFEIVLESAFREPGKLSEVVASLKRLPWADEVEFGQEWVERFSSFLGVMEVAAFTVGLFLGVAVIFIISNTIRLTIYARRDEIEIMRQLGASESFIKIPFFIEGVVMGFAGGVVATFMLLLGLSVLSSKVPSYFAFAVENPFSLPVLLAALIVSGVVIGTLGSFFSLSRFLKG